VEICPCSFVHQASWTSLDEKQLNADLDEKEGNADKDMISSDNEKSEKDEQNEKSDLGDTRMMTRQQRCPLHQCLSSERERECDNCS
jgi:hypothetical protein